MDALLFCSGILMLPGYVMEQDFVPNTFCHTNWYEKGEQSFLPRILLIPSDFPINFKRLEFLLRMFWH